MKRWFAAAGLCLALLPGAAQAEAPSDPLGWLNRIASAGQRLNYVGTFVYQSGKHFETSRIAHRVDSSGEYERLEVLDGSPREVIRNSGEVRCVLPDQKTVIIDRPGGRRAFPARLPSSFSNLGESYRIRKGEVHRIAGLEAQAILLEPKDDLRYGHALWAEVQSGLLLKSRLLDERGEIIEQFVFNDVRIGGNISPDLLKPRYVSTDDWRVVQARGSDVPRSEAGWALRTPLPGFTLQSVVKRPLGRERGDVVQMVYGDGLASISLFIEPAASDSAAAVLGAQTSGAINIYKRVAGAHLITVLGEVPMRTIQRLGDGMEFVGQ
ncbi:MucB/RseB C-terminal domain-containing protein [Azoarcus olearius]|uniref:Sigma factor regulatory protein n=1 Tax=Azoarcus sp. (strain BH72) TaxID=418699 RepID=A1K5Z4_AZOSB|nr:MucB/RseB C-terminal domain-containing protein [Azoarcus olearius]ANQ84799.1 putative sigma factor regulatory protein [Azoarcus olearius]CAL94249.1 putative sigma factor regulatory protein [Azoarcus olearius]